jgi:hypothetical protein
LGTTGKSSHSSCGGLGEGLDQEDGGLADELEVGVHGLAPDHEAVVADASDDVGDEAMLDHDG